MATHTGSMLFSDYHYMVENLMVYSLNQFHSHNRLSGLYHHSLEDKERFTSSKNTLHTLLFHCFTYIPHVQVYLYIQTIENMQQCREYERPYQYQNSDKPK